MVSCWGKKRERDHRGDLGVDGWIILVWICGDRAVYRVLVGKLAGKRPLGRPWRRCVDNIRMHLWVEVVYRFLVGKLEGKRPLRRPSRRWVDNIRMDMWGEGGL